MTDKDREKYLASTTTTSDNRMTDKERDAFLNEPIIGRLATVRADGYPQITPVWPSWDGEAMHFLLGENRIHTKNLRRDPRATIIVDEDFRVTTKRYGAGAAAVVMRGEVELLDLDASEGPLEEQFKHHAEKFLNGAVGDEDFWNTESGERYHACILRPVHIMSWDFRKFKGSGG